jgi:trk system potassium uptake protein TrkA
MDRDQETVQRLSERVTKAVQGDAADPEALEEAGFGSCDIVVVAIGSNVEASIMATMALKDLKVPKIVAKASSDIHGKVLDRIGAHQIVNPERDRATRLARTLMAKSILEYFQVDTASGIIEIESPEAFIDKSVAVSGIRSQYGLAILGIRRAPDAHGVRENLCVPSGADIIRRGDVLVLFGPEENLREMEKTVR